VPAVVAVEVEPLGAADAVPAAVVLLPTGYGIEAIEDMIAEVAGVVIGVVAGVVIGVDAGVDAGVVAGVEADVVATEADDMLLADWVEVEAERVALLEETPPMHSTASR